MTKLFYLGCINKAGHYLWKDQDTEDSYYGNKEIPEHILSKLDTGFCPKDTAVIGFVQRTNIDDWVILSWWDRSVDSRPGSHSTFAAQGFKNMGELQSEMRNKFPVVFSRQKVTLEFPMFLDPATDEKFNWF